MPLAHFRKKKSLLFLQFSPEFRLSNIFAVTEHTRNQIFLASYQQIFFLKIFSLVLVDEFFEICIFIWNQYNATNYLERRMGYKEQRLKIGERERETRNRDIRLGTEDGRQGTKSETWNRGWETKSGKQGTEK
jgi:hypothetical protein